MSSLQYQPANGMLADAARIASDAGAFVWGRFGSAATIRPKGEVAPGGRVLDLVTEVDLEAEALIRSAILDCNPAAVILGEEGGVLRADGTPAGESLEQVDDLWLVDPIDGTINFAMGVPLFCVSVARYRQGVPVCGAIHVPSMAETFTFETGSGARLDGSPIKVNRRAAAEGLASLSGVGSSFRELARHYMGWRRFGSAALTLAWVAAGRLDAYVQLGSISPWDHAVGVPLVLEAGGMITNHVAEPWTYPLSSTSGIIAGTADAHSTAVRVLAQLGHAMA